ncbi:hypothetical protein PM082_019150 [Marasmius tenuissimus]|nr:hypothetical protein PM082_019150 [Marasmius tenuissimus]
MLHLVPTPHCSTIMTQTLRAIGSSIVLCSWLMTDDDDTTRTLSFPFFLTTFYYSTPFTPFTHITYRSLSSSFFHGSVFSLARDLGRGHPPLTQCSQYFDFLPPTSLAHLVYSVLRYI